jgi:hypothetical protein
MKQLVWHYAPWQYLSAMVSVGFLKTSNARADGEHPLLWFSANQQWEPTATKFVQNWHDLVRLTFNQQAEKFGCVRFGLPADDPRLLNWRDACRAAKTPRDYRRRMEKVGGKLGSKPDDWFATVVDVPLADLLFQVWLYQLSWQPANPVEMAAV